MAPVFRSYDFLDIIVAGSLMATFIRLLGVLTGGIVGVDVRCAGSADVGPRIALVKAWRNSDGFFSICGKHNGNCVQLEIGSSGFARITERWLCTLL
jgi:hypothetical protein